MDRTGSGSRQMTGFDSIGVHPLGYNIWELVSY